MKTIELTLALCFLGAAVCFAQGPQMGTWKLNEAKSKFTPGTAKNNTVVFEAVGDQVKVTQDGTDKDGKPTHNVWTGKFDGKDYPVTSDPTGSDTRSYKKLGCDNALEVTVKKNGEVTLTAQSVVSSDGKSRTVTSSGKSFINVAVFDKQ